MAAPQAAIGATPVPHLANQFIVGQLPQNVLQQMHAPQPAIAQAAAKPTLQAATDLDPNASLLFKELARMVSNTIATNKTSINLSSITRPEHLLSSAFINQLDASKQKSVAEALVDTVGAFVNNRTDAIANQGGDIALLHLIQETNTPQANQHLVEAVNNTLAELANMNEPSHISNLTNNASVEQQAKHRDSLIAKYGSRAEEVAKTTGRAAGAIKAFFEKSTWNSTLPVERLTSLITIGMQQNAATTLAELRAGAKRYDHRYGSPEMKDVRSLETIKDAVNKSGAATMDAHVQQFVQELTLLISNKTAQVTN